MIDDEKVPDSGFVEAVTLYGVRIQSRYGKRAEYRAMSMMVKALSPTQRRAVLSVWCDSKAQKTYAVSLRTLHGIDELANAFHRAAISADGGYNGFDFTLGGKHVGDLAAWWDTPQLDPVSPSEARCDFVPF